MYYCCDIIFIYLLNWNFVGKISTEKLIDRFY